jgi:hypothetical protein
MDDSYPWMGMTLLFTQMSANHANAVMILFALSALIITRIATVSAQRRMGLILQYSETF